jgi:RNA polymerase sigma factor (sigma-70 family)
MNSATGLQILAKIEYQPRNPEAWVRSATELMLRNELRKTNRLTPVTLLAAQLQVSDGTEQKLSLASDIEFLLHTLRPEYAEIIRLCDLEEHSIEEVAQKLHKSVAAVYKTHERAKAKARAILIRMGYRGGDR